MRTVGIGFYWNDLKVGEQFRTLNRTVTEADIVQFIGVTGMVETLFTDLSFGEHHGAIKDEAAGLQPLEFFSKSWTVEDPSARILLMQSAPLVVPYRVDASFCATVR